MKNVNDEQGANLFEKFCNFLFIHHEAEIGIWFKIVKTAIGLQAEICIAKCLKCGAFCSAIQSNYTAVICNDAPITPGEGASLLRQCASFSIKIVTQGTVIYSWCASHHTPWGSSLSVTLPWCVILACCGVSNLITHRHRLKKHLKNRCTEISFIKKIAKIGQVKTTTVAPHHV